MRLSINLVKISSFFKTIPPDKHTYRYASGKWTIKDIMVHLTDSERVFSYRALHFARQDPSVLSGYNQDDYVISANANTRDLNELIEDYINLRKSTISLFKSFTPPQLSSIGKANESNMSVRALGYIISGHENHHISIIKERYL